ncbi:MAG: FKBP-type peptidyl-prolyl cis-trans isomerase [Candidatus Yanofskybacteria bacterium]|nr:FKBP-type peptidyl-prolyl cis-trans isomerase [Candidatus Yanofskybacteria bacterium]
MVKTFFIFLILVLAVGGGIWFFVRKNNEIQGANLDAALNGTASPTPAVSPSVDTSHLIIEDLKVGTGPAAQAGQAVTVHYTGWLTNGQKFDSSVDRGQPFSFILGGGMVIPGWDQGLVGMKVGGKRKLTIPPDLAYGPRGAGGVIPPNATLVFEVDLLGVQAPK